MQRALDDIVAFVALGSPLRLRSYQAAPARAITDSVIHRKGQQLVVMFPRQSGKNELQAHIEAYLLCLYADQGGEIVKVSPTWKPQSLNAMRRLQRVLENNLFTRNHWVKEQGYIYRIGQARIYFLSGEPTSHIVGATASLLLECDEAQDVSLLKWDKEISPMAAAYNTTQVFWGTAWTRHTLLARQLQLAQQASGESGSAGVFRLDADQVAQEVPAYGVYVAEQVRRFGRSHPLIKTQFYSQELDDEGGMFSLQQQALMQGSHPPACSPRPGSVYALLVDVGGEIRQSKGANLEAQFNFLENVGQAHARRDDTALTVVEVDLSSLADTNLRAPGYRVVQRYAWKGAAQSNLHAQILALANHWQAHSLVIDATGIGAGLASFLEKSLGSRRVIPFVFSARTKSSLGWDFISVIETGRYKEFSLPAETPTSDRQAVLQGLFWEQVRACRSTLGVGENLQWGVPEGTRHPVSKQPLHDDLLLSAALCAALDKQGWNLGSSAVLPSSPALRAIKPVY